MSTSKLNPKTRTRVLERLAATEYDVLVIGGGVTGAGVALDAATRGLSVALVEKRDWASGTSSRSGKLIHGGLRYLEQLNFGLVREALRERRLILKTLAPHLAVPLQFLYPLKHRVWERAYMGSGVMLYDTMGGAGAVPHHGHVTLSTIRRIAPGLDDGQLIGGLTFFDVQIDDARHTMELVRTAASRGADVASAVAVKDLVVEDGAVVGAKVIDAETGTETAIRARVVVNATGVWSDRIREMAPGRPPFSVRASKGIHLMVPRDRIDSTISLFVRAEDSVLFVRIWGDHWLIGTTDTTWKESLDHPAATATDVEYLLRNVNRVLKTKLTTDDIDGVFSGLRPLVTADKSVNSKLSREHAVETSPHGLITVAGGKYTTYRVMAKDVIDEAAKSLGTKTPCTTATVRMIGAIGLEAATNRLRREASGLGIDDAHVEHLLRRYGSMVADILDLVHDRPDLAAPVPAAEAYLRAEIVYAVTHEGALHIDDVLTRRTHIAIDTHHRGLDSVEVVGALIAGELGWDRARTAAEVEHYRERVRVERESEKLPDDVSAAKVRDEVLDPRVVATHLEEQ